MRRTRKHRPWNKNLVITTKQNRAVQGVNRGMGTPSLLSASEAATALTEACWGQELAEKEAT
jgi:hypothetical protein